MGKKIVILGNGIAGVTAARYIRKWSENEIIIISEETEHFFSRTALMYIYMGHMNYEDTKPYEDHFWAKNRIELIQDRVKKIDFESKKLYFSPSKCLSYDSLILAVGSKPRFFNWPGQDALGVQGLYSYQDLELMQHNTDKEVNRAVVVGGGLIGIEMAEMLLSRNIPVTFLVRESSYWNSVLPPEESAMINRHILEHKVDLRLGTELKEICKDNRGAVKAIVTQSGEKIDCQFVGLTTGVTPNIDFLIDTPLETSRGILVNSKLQTNIPDVWAIGDCAEFKLAKPGRSLLEQVWYTGKMQGETVAHNICLLPTDYQPRIWFNSAKFFDIEYQVYGSVPSVSLAGHESLYWEHPKGKKSIRINYEIESGVVLGFNLMGIRYNHLVCEKWLKEKATIKTVLKELSNANFDAEFYSRYENEIRSLFSKKIAPPTPVQVIQNQQRT